MNRLAAYFKNRICLWLLPLMLSAAVGSVLIQCYAPDHKLPMTVAYAGFSLACFVLFDWLHKRRVLGGILYTVLLITAVALAMRFVFTGEYKGQASMTFQQWFYGIGTEKLGTELVRPYFFALCIGGGFFINSVLYYFTQIQYRALGTLLIIFIPFVIYAKREDTMSDLTVTVIITLFIAIIVHNRIFLDPDSGKGTLVNTAYVMSIALFVSVTGALAMIFPDLSTPSRLEKDASFLNYAGISGGGRRLDNSSSSTHFHGVKYTNEPLFYVYPEDMKDIETPIYLRRRSMNAYDAEQLDWYASRDLLDLEGVNYTLDVSFPDLYDALTTWGQQDRLPIEPELYEHEEEKHTYTFDIEFDSDIGEVPYIPAPLYSKVKLEEGGTIDTEYSDYYPVPWNVTVNELGTVTVETVKCSQQAEEFAAKAGGSFEQFIGVMRSAMKSLERIAENGETYENEDGTPKNGYELEAFMAQYYENYYAYAQQNYCYDPEYMLEAGLKDYKKIKALADEICKDCKSDYEKAKAIEQYFTDEGFEYDLEYIPEEETVSYFLFESKKGICIDFATAMGVMMIMERIPVRYVEGFVAFERDPEDSSRLIVRDSHAHAFIEAFIPYVGWMTFDPTVAGYMDITIGEDKDDTGTLGLILAYMGRILLVLGVLFVLVFIILFDRIWELCFRGTLRFYSPDKKLTRLYRHIFKLLEYEDKTDLEPYTAKLLNDYLRDKTGQSLTAVTDLFEQHRFGNRPVSEAQFEAAFEAYKALYPKIRKKK